MHQSIQDKLTGYFSAYGITEYPKGKIITYAGDEPKGISQLVEGIIEQYDITPEGNKVTVNVFRPPAFFPMSWAINKTPNTYFYAALTAIKLRQADADKTVAFLQANPDVLFDLLRRVYKGTDGLLRRLVLAASGVAINRMIFELLIEAYRFGDKIDDDKIIVTIRQNVLAARSGLARETVNRELHRLEKEGLLSVQKQGIVFNVQQLEQKMDFSI